MPRVRKIVFSILLGLLLIPAAVVICIQVPVVQTALCNFVAGRVAREVGGQASIGRIYLSPPNYLILKDILVTQNDGRDTVAHIGKFLLKVNAPSCFGDNPQIHRIALEKGTLHLEQLQPLLARFAALKPVADQSETDTLREKEGLPFKSLTLDMLRIRDFDLSVRNFNKEPVDRSKRPVKLDWADLHLQDINLEMNSIVISDSITCNIRNLSAKELHGFDMNTFRCGVVMKGDGIHIDGLNYNDGYSNLVAPRLDLLFDGFTAFSDFCNKVTFDATFDNTFLDFRSLRYYGVKDGLELKLYVNGRVVGPVSHLDSKRLDVYTGTRQTHLRLVPHIVGLPASKSTKASVKVSLTTNSTDIAQVVSEVSKNKNFNRKKISRLAPGERISFRGSLDGLFTDFVAYGALEGENLGTADVDIICRADKERGYTVDGYLETERFDLGLLLQSKAMGPLTCSGQATVFTGKNLDVLMDNLSVDSFSLSGREFNDMELAGRFSNGGLKLNMNCNDDWVKFGLRTEIDKLSLENTALSLGIDALEFYQDSTRYQLGDILLSAESEPERGSSLHLSSSFADLGFDSDRDFAHFFNSLSRRDYSDLRAGISLLFKNSEPLFNVFVPSLFIERGSSLTYEYSPEEFGNAILQSELVVFGNTYLKDLTVRTVSDSLDNVNVKILSDLIRCGSLDFQSARVDLDAFNDTSRTFVGRINGSQFLFGGHKWGFQSDTVTVCGKDVRVDSLVLANAGHSIAVDGILSDRMAMKLNDIDLSLLESLFGNSVSLGGSFNGECSIVNFFGENGGILADLRGDSLTVNRRLFGDMEIRALWNTIDSKVDLSLENRLDGELPLSVKGSYFPSGGNIDLNVALDRLNPGLFEPFLAGVVKDLDGALSGNLTLAGPRDTLTLSGEGCRMDGVGCTLVYTNVPYIIDGPFSVDNSGIRLDGLSIYDRAGNRGQVSGGILFDNLKGMKLNTRIAVDNLMALNTTFKDNSTFYGKAYASGSVHLGGGSKNLLLDISARTEEHTDIHIPVGSSGKEVQSLLTFIPSRKTKISAFDSLIAIRTAAGKKASGKGLDLRLRVEATPLAKVQLEINRSTGDILKASGDGKLTIRAGAGQGFDIKGDYVVQNGSYRFTLVGGMLSKDFVIEPGGTISMNGNIMESQLDLIAKYRTKASLSTLIADTSSVGPRRNVECGIGLTGRLSNPELSFSVDIPDLDPTSMSQVDAALNTEEKRMKQVLSLLLSGSFVPEQNGGIANTSTVLYSNVTEIMANQFNNIFRQLEIPLDFGFNYQPSSDGRSLFDVAVSTQLFNNRVIINGNIGNRKNTTSNSSDIVGDVDVQIKLNKTGKLLLNLFSHSADQYSNYLDQAQRNGAGLVYKEEFDTFRELWRKMFWSKKRREAEERKIKEEMELK